MTTATEPKAAQPKPKCIKLRCLEKRWAGTMMLEPGDVFWYPESRVKVEAATGVVLYPRKTEIAEPDAQAISIPKRADPPAPGGGPRRPFTVPHA